MRVTHRQLETARAEIWKFCARYAATPARGYTLIIYGENGCGKSRIAKAIATWAQRIAMRLPLVVDELSPEAPMTIPTAWFSNWPKIVDGMKTNEWQVLEDLQAASMLIIDDVGAEHDPSKCGVEKLYILLNHREHRWNIITTNIPPSGWEEKFERRISSRLFRNAQHIDLSSVPDFSTL